MNAQRNWFITKASNALFPFKLYVGSKTVVKVCTIEFTNFARVYDRDDMAEQQIWETEFLWDEEEIFSDKIHKFALYLIWHPLNYDPHSDRLRAAAVLYWHFLRSRISVLLCLGRFSLFLKKMYHQVVHLRYAPGGTGYQETFNHFCAHV